MIGRQCKNRERYWRIVEKFLYGSRNAVSATCGFNNTDCPEIAPGGACSFYDANATTRLQQQACFAMNQRCQLANRWDCFGLSIRSMCKLSFLMTRFPALLSPIMFSLGSFRGCSAFLQVCYPVLFSWSLSRLRVVGTFVTFCRVDLILLSVS